MKTLKQFLIENKLKKIDSTHYIHYPSGFHIVQHQDKSWDVYDTFEDNGDLKNNLSPKHKNKKSAISAASLIYRRISRSKTTS